MSTRGAYGFIIDGVEKITYNHCDSYPECLGDNFIEWLKTKTIEELKDIAKKIELVNERVATTKEMVDYVQEFEACNNVVISATSVSNQTLEDVYCLLRETQGNFSLLDKGFKYMIDRKDFLYSSLFCEYAYIANLDTGIFEYYEGFSEESGKGRYNTPESLYDGYYGVALEAEIPLNKLPVKLSDYIESLNKE